MKITEVRAVYPHYQHVVPSWRTHFWQIVVRVETDTDDVGFGYGGGLAGDWADFAEMHSDHIREQRDVLWLDEPAAQDGYITPSDRPGFGVTLNEEML